MTDNLKLTQKVVDGIGLDTDRVVWDDEALGPRFC